jgi:Spy/CpxP family protein refolding chaperone
MLRTKLMAWLGVGILGLAAAAIPLKVWAAEGGKGPGKWKENPLGRLIGGRLAALGELRQDVNLTAEQRQQLRKIVVSHRAAIADEANKLWQKRNALRDAVLAEKTDEEAIRKAADDLGKQIGEAAVKAAKLKQELAPVLTSEQRAKVKEFIQENDKAVGDFFEQASKK